MNGTFIIKLSPGTIKWASDSLNLGNTSNKGTNYYGKDGAVEIK